LVATLPPIVDHGALAGSGGYHRPCSATAALTSLLTAPGCTTQTRLSGSISRTWFIRDRSRTTQPLTALAPPDRPGARAARHDRGAEFGAGAHHVLHFGLGPGAHAGDGLPRPCPLGLVLRDGGEHVRVDHEAVAGQAAAQRLDEGGGGDRDLAGFVR
jgi:hypothetical protein